MAAWKKFYTICASRYSLSLVITKQQVPKNTFEAIPEFDYGKNYVDEKKTYTRKLKKICSTFNIFGFFGNQKLFSHFLKNKKKGRFCSKGLKKGQFPRKKDSSYQKNKICRIKTRFCGIYKL